MRYDRQDAELAIESLSTARSAKDAAEQLGISYDSLKRLLRKHGYESPAAYLPSGLATSSTMPSVGRFPPPPTAPQIGDPQDLLQIADFCRKRPRSLEELCDHLGQPPVAVRALVKSALAAGYALAVAGDELGWRLPQGDYDDALELAVVSSVSDEIQLGVLGDTHYGSAFCRDDLIDAFCRDAYARGVRTFLQVGDLLDGTYRHSQFEMRASGWDKQAEEACRLLPRLEGARYYFIDGNHDESAGKEIGMLSGKRLVEYFAANGRSDLHYLGARQGFLRLRVPGCERAISVEMWHPRKSTGFTLSYGAQCKVRDTAANKLTDLLLIGHWHKYCSFIQQRCHVVLCGCFQSGLSSFGRSLGGDVALGGQIVTLAPTPTGFIRHFGVRRTSYEELDEIQEIQAVYSEASDIP